MTPRDRLIQRDVKPDNTPSPAQAALLDEMRALALRASRLGHVRETADAAAVLRFIRYAIEDAFSALQRAERLGGRVVFKYTTERGAELDWIGPPAQVIEIAPYIQRRRGAS